jgi:hypothetical protein
MMIRVRIQSLTILPRIQLRQRAPLNPNAQWGTRGAPAPEPPAHDGVVVVVAV